MKSKQYEKYLVLSHANTLFHAGLMLCLYIFNGNCAPSKGMFPIDTKKGGTNRFGFHMRTHEKSMCPTKGIQDLDGKCRDETPRAGALAIILDLRPMKFAEEHEGMAIFAESIFKAGQTIPYGVSINRQSYLPTRTAIRSSLEKMVQKWRLSFRGYLNNELMSSGGAVSIDGMTLKIQARHFLDFTVHHIHVQKGKTALERPTFSIISSTILLIEGPDVGSGTNKRALLDENLRSLYGVDFNSIQKQFTIVTDGEASMARMANSSVSSRVCPRDENWMRCYVHVLQNCMKSVFALCADDDCLQKIGLDFKCAKRIIEDSKRYGWNKDLPVGYRLIQDVETRFGTLFLFTERFLKSASKVWDIIDTQRREIARSSFEALESRTDEDGSSSHSYPCLEAIVDAFQVVYEAVVEFQASHEPTLHKILPSLQYCKTELIHIERGGAVCRDNNITRSPSIYSMRLCGVMKQELEKIEIHGLWLVSCFLYPFLRDMEFWKDPLQREQFKSRAEKLTRSMCDSLDSSVSGDSTFGFSLQSMDSNDAESNEPQRKRKRFSLKGQLTVMDPHGTLTDEVSRYKCTKLVQLGLIQESFLSEPFSVVQFWYSRKSMYPTLFKVALRIFATPASSSSSERVFSTLKKLVSPDRSTISAKHISEIITGRSLRFYQ